MATGLIIPTLQWFSLQGFTSDFLHAFFSNHLVLFIERRYLIVFFSSVSLSFSPPPPPICFSIHSLPPSPDLLLYSAPPIGFYNLLICFSNPRICFSIPSPTICFCTPQYVSIYPVPRSVSILPPFVSLCCSLH